MKKLLSLILAAAAATSLALPAMAAPVSVTRNLFDLSGAPVDANGVQITGDTLAPGQTIYFLLPGAAGKVLSDTGNFRLTYRKAKNAKLVKSVAITEKRLGTSGTTYQVPNGFKTGEAADTATAGTQHTFTSGQLTNSVPAANRNIYLAVVLNETASSDELKVELDLTFSARKNASPATAYSFPYGTGVTKVPDPTPGAAAGAALDVANKPFLTTPLAASGDRLYFNLDFYVMNPTTGGDGSISVGETGMTVKPIANDYNEISFESRNDTLATLSFNASSNPEKFYAKLSTKWTSDLSAKFKNADAFIRRFSNATVPTTSRAKLSMANPFDESVKPSKIYIYEVSTSGVLSEITSKVTYNANDDVFSLQTRTLGTYILSDTKIKLK